MAGGFGFANYAGARKTPSSQAVGQALMQGGGQMAGGAAPAEMPMGPGQMAPTEMLMGPGQMAPPVPPDQAMREDGARRMTGPGQVDDNAEEGDGTHSANAVNTAIGEALTRMGGGYRTNPNPHKDRARAMQLMQQHGLSETEARLLVESGGL